MAETITTIENGQGGCCICCKADSDKTCYCGCCPCVPAGSLTFSVIDCSITYGGVPAGTGCTQCAKDWSFTLTKQDTECIVHTVGDIHGQGEITCSTCLNEYDGTPPAGATYNEVWGYSGTVCGGSCESDSPPAKEESCGGMCIRASLCCCKTGVPETEEYTTDEHPCPVTTAASCPTSTGTPCSQNCFWFGMSAYECYDIDGDGVVDSPCSPCAAVQPSFGPLIPGSLFGGGGYHCFNPPITGQCGTDEKPFMLAYEGTFPIACDCQTGNITYAFGGAVSSYDPVQMTIKVLIHE